MLEVTNAKLAGEPAWKLWILHQVARLLRVPIGVRGMPYGHHEISPERPCQADQMRPEQTERALELARGLLQGTGAETLSGALSRSDRRCVFQRSTERPGPADSTR